MWCVQYKRIPKIGRYPALCGYVERQGDNCLITQDIESAFKFETKDDAESFVVDNLDIESNTHCIEINYIEIK